MELQQFFYVEQCCGYSICIDEDPVFTTPEGSSSQEERDRRPGWVEGVSARLSAVQEEISMPNLIPVMGSPFTCQSRHRRPPILVHHCPVVHVQKDGVCFQELCMENGSKA